MELGFRIDIEAQKQYFLAFCYPWSYLKNLVKIYYFSLFIFILEISRTFRKIKKFIFRPRYIL